MKKTLISFFYYLIGLVILWGPFFIFLDFNKANWFKFGLLLILDILAFTGYWHLMRKIPFMKKHYYD